ncbi:MAG TPA: AmmeMemoRadiSam system radical SAM enzyme [Lachnospiraceae bacterium]|nr:AmmeMemoRadiSam system radical SAM enzyme [Lachnospiraceae bacterium]
MKCDVCPNYCTLAPGQIGKCHVRKNSDNKIVCDNYGQITSLALDPIEKKPLKHFYPGSNILSVGSYGCNLRCSFCQNHEISMCGANQVQTTYLAPKDLAEQAEQLRNRGNIGVAFTYNEPLISYEYVRDTARIVQAKGMKNVVVTNGTANPWILEEMLPYIDAMNIDLKGFTKEFYEKIGGSLETVKEFIQIAAAHCHVELTTLIIPEENDEIEQMRGEVAWIASVNPEIVLHISRFFPRYQMLDKEATSVPHMKKLAEAAREKLTYVYLGNC